MKVTRREFAGVIAAAAAGLALPGCGYSLAGRGNFLPDYIKIIGIPPFVNHSPVPNFDQVLTEATSTEFIGRGRRVQPTAEGADAVLTATINGVATSPINFTNRQTSRVQIIVTA